MIFSILERELCVLQVIGLSPTLELSTKQELTPWTPVAIGFLLGGILSKVMDNIIPHIHSNLPPESVEGPKTKCKK